MSKELEKLASILKQHLNQLKGHFDQWEIKIPKKYPDFDSGKDNPENYLLAFYFIFENIHLRTQKSLTTIGAVAAIGLDVMREKSDFQQAIAYFENMEPDERVVTLCKEHIKLFEIIVAQKAFAFLEGNRLLEKFDLTYDYFIDSVLPDVFLDAQWALRNYQQAQAAQEKRQLEAEKANHEEAVLTPPSEDVAHNEYHHELVQLENALEDSDKTLAELEANKSDQVDQQRKLEKALILKQKAITRLDHAANELQIPGRQKPASEAQELTEDTKSRPATISSVVSDLELSAKQATQVDVDLNAFLASSREKALQSLKQLCRDKSSAITAEVASMQSDAEKLTASIAATEQQIATNQDQQNEITTHILKLKAKMISKAAAHEAQNRIERHAAQETKPALEPAGDSVTSDTTAPSPSPSEQQAQRNAWRKFIQALQALWQKLADFCTEIAAEKKRVKSKAADASPSPDTVQAPIKGANKQ